MKPLQIDPKNHLEESVNVLHNICLVCEITIFLPHPEQNAPPTVVAVVRASEILLALLIDKIIFDSRQTSTWPHSVGAISVLLGVSLMSCHMQIQDRLDDLFSCRKRTQMLPIKSENIDPT